MALDGIEQIPITRRCEILISAVTFTLGASLIGPLVVVINGQRTRHSATTAKGRETAPHYPAEGRVRAGGIEKFQLS